MIHLAVLAGLLGVMTALWTVSLAVRDASIVDLFWGPAIALAGWAAWALSGHGDASAGPAGGVRALVALVCASVWAARLGVYLAFRNLGRGEDYRYRAMRAAHGRRFALV